MIGNFYLIDLERSLATSKRIYWRGNLHGYTDTVKEAGIFSESTAIKKCECDLNRKTVMLPIGGLKGATELLKCTANIIEHCNIGIEEKNKIINKAYEEYLKNTARK